MYSPLLILLVSLIPAGGTVNGPPDRIEPASQRDVEERPSLEALERIARLRRYPEQIRKIEREHFGRIRSPQLREAGKAELRQFTDPAAFRPMWRELRDQAEDIWLTVLDHFVEQGEDGQAALAWVAISEPGEGETSSLMQHEALRRLSSPAPPPVIDVLNAGILDHDDGTASRAASVAGSLNALETIPQLIFGQVMAPSHSGEQGDLAWIAVNKQTVYVAQVVPIVNNGAVAFQPILGVLNEGFVFRAHDAVVIIYRHIVHRVLVRMTTDDWGQSTDDLGYDQGAWIDWYNDTYVPFKNAQIREAELAGEGDAPP